MRLEEATQRLAALEGDVRELAQRHNALVAGLDPRGSTLQLQRAWGALCLSADRDELVVE